VVVDEFGDLMLQARADVERAVVRLGQLGRACGVHLILATQSPHREILSGLIKANVPARIALRVASGTHSRVAIDTGGAELLNGHGDALLADGQTFGTTRFQSAYVPRDVIRWVVRHWTYGAPSPGTEDRTDPEPGSVAPVDRQPDPAPAPAKHPVTGPRVKFTVTPAGGAWSCRMVTT
jgi:S-DNA-T family DNA segregation ATPase FtsK/SpoIIIE